MNDLWGWSNPSPLFLDSACINFVGGRPETMQLRGPSVPSHALADRYSSRRILVEQTDKFRFSSQNCSERGSTELMLLTTYTHGDECLAHFAVSQNLSFTPN